MYSSGDITRYMDDASIENHMMSTNWNPSDATNPSGVTRSRPNLMNKPPAANATTTYAMRPDQIVESSLPSPSGSLQHIRTPESTIMMMMQLKVAPQLKKPSTSQFNRNFLRTKYNSMASTTTAENGTGRRLSWSSNTFLATSFAWVEESRANKSLHVEQLDRVDVSPSGDVRETSKSAMRLPT
ncbi:hypothetical protein FI667_g9214, partial [Globisporangium splendens]